MHSERWSGVRRYLVVGLSLGALALGFGLVWWASVNIGAQPRSFVDVYQNPPSGVITIVMGPPSPAGTESVGGSPSDMSDVANAVYVKNPVAGDILGSLSIPALNRKLLIIEGTGNDELKRGAGHFSQSVLPGEKDNCVLSGHRDTVFRGLDKLKKGDLLVVETATGTFTYKISRIRIVDADDKTVIVPTKRAVLTVTTCYPFNYVGSAPDRYILVANLVSGR